MNKDKFRQIAAIMFTDIVGYTALMHGDEEAATKVRARHRLVFEQQHEQHNGEIVQYYGDGTLSIFKSAVAAANCAIRIQHLLQEGEPVPLRIGLHLGDIVFNKTDVYGDGVNFASRIESLSVAGAILISGKLNDELKNHATISTVSLGHFELKNITLPVEVFAISNKGIVVPKPSDLKGKQKKIYSAIAVLPFVNMSGDPQNEYFSDGITEELLNALTKVDGLQVTSRTSAFAFKGKNADIREIGIQLNVDRILEGSVRKSGNRVRITAQLINTADGYHIWSETYDRDITDIFEVQDEISIIIANKLRENLTVRAHEETIVKAPTQNLEAYNCFLKGLHFQNKITPNDFKKAVCCFEEAINLQPDYAQAYAMSASCYAFLGATGQMQPKKAFKFVHQYSDKALKLDPSLAMAYVAKGSAYLLYDWEWNLAYQSLVKAIELNPATTSAHQLLALYYMSTGRKREAVDIMEKALQVDPLSPIVNQHLADAYLNAGRNGEALKQAERLIDLYPDMRAALELKGWCTGINGDWNKASLIFEEVQRLTKHPLKGFAALGHAYGRLGKTEKAWECIRKIEQRQMEEPGTVLDIDLAMVLWSLGEKDRAFHHLFQSVEKRMGVVAILIDHPMFSDAFQSPNYQLIKEKLNLVKYTPAIAG